MISINIKATGSVAHCRIHGELDSYGAAALREGMARLGDFRSVVLDLSGATFIDSAGLSVIVGAIRRMQHNGSDIVLAAARPSIERVLRMVGLHRIVILAASTDEALRCLAHPAAS